MTPAYEALQPERFRATVNGRETGLFTLRAGRMEASVTNYGARLVQVLAPDRRGELGDVLLGYPSIGQYQAGQKSMGAFIGRYAGRIAHGRFALDGTTHQLAANNGSHTLHGGPHGSRFQVFEAQRVSEASVAMAWLFSGDGFPGDLSLRVTYTVTDAHELAIEYSAEALGRATVANLTSHGYFNLSGGPAPAQPVAPAPIGGHVLQIEAAEVLETDPDGIPTGQTLSVAGTPLDFRQPTLIGPGLASGHPLLAPRGGYDHTFMLGGDGALRRAATVHDPASGRTMEVWTTEPCLQLFTANTLDGITGLDRGKNGAVHALHTSLCLEAQFPPDAPNHSHFPSTILHPGASRTGRTVYRFGAVP